MDPGYRQLVHVGFEQCEHPLEQLRSAWGRATAICRSTAWHEMSHGPFFQRLKQSSHQKRQMPEGENSHEGGSFVNRTKLRERPDGRWLSGPEPQAAIKDFVCGPEPKPVFICPFWP